MSPMLTPHGMTVFNYYRRYKDNSMIRFSTDRAWTEHFFKKHYHNAMTTPSADLSKPLSYYIWIIEDCPDMLRDAALNFNTSNGITVVMDHEQYTEYFGFATTTSNKGIINNFYINHLDVLENYCRGFKDQAQSLLIQGEKNRLIISPKAFSSERARGDSANQFSRRQMDCAKWLIQGLTYKEIAIKLNVSPRTIETHLNQMKIRTGSANSRELVAWLMSFANTL